MKKLFIFISSFLFTIFSVPSWANLEGVAVIDYHTIFLGTDLARTSFEELRESGDYKELMEEAQLKDSERLSIAEELNKDSSTMSDEEQSEKLKKAQSLYQDIQFLTQKMQTLENEVVQKLQADQGPNVQKVINDLIVAKKIQLLLGADKALYFDGSVSITEQVTDALDGAAAAEPESN